MGLLRWIEGTERKGFEARSFLGPFKHSSILATWHLDLERSSSSRATGHRRKARLFGM